MGRLSGRTVLVTDARIKANARANSAIDERGLKSRELTSWLKRPPSAGNMGHAAVFLASDEVAKIIGVTLKIDAGMPLMGPQ